MGRSLKKGPFVEPKLLEKIDRMNKGSAKKPIKTWSRRSMITPDFVGHTFCVHNGKIFNSIFVTENMVGHKLGEFSLTRQFKKHGAHTAKVAKKERNRQNASNLDLSVCSDFGFQSSRSNSRDPGPICFGRFGLIGL